MARPSRFSPEVRERAVRMVFEHAQDHACSEQESPDAVLVEQVNEQICVHRFESRRPFGRSGRSKNSKRHPPMRP